jgi:hypothetical protein
MIWSKLETSNLFLGIDQLLQVQQALHFFYQSSTTSLSSCMISVNCINLQGHQENFVFSDLEFYGTLQVVIILELCRVCVATFAISPFHDKNYNGGGVRVCWKLPLAKSSKDFIMDLWRSQCTPSLTSLISEYVCLAMSMIFEHSSKKMQWRCLITVEDRHAYSRCL